MATKILFFGPLRDLVGASERQVELPGNVSDCAQLIEWLAGGNAVLAERLAASGVRISIDKVIVDENASIVGAAEIGFLPPFSGG